MHPIRLKLPGKPPRVIQKEQQPDQRQFSVVPIRAITDRGLTPMELRVLLVFCSYANRGGITWVGLKRVGEHLNIGVARTATLASALIKKGYIRVLFKGFAGERAQTRQIIFNDALSLEDIIAVAGEKAPYQVQQDIRQHQEHQDIQYKKESNMARKRKINDQTVSNSVQSNLLPGNKAGTIDQIAISESQVLELQRAVGPELLSLALDRAGAGASYDQVKRTLEVMLK